MKIGAHISAAGGLHNAPKNAAALGLECFQFFSRPPQGGRVSPITDADAGLFLNACAANGFEDYYIHAPYIINLASAEERIRKNSVQLLRTELERASKLRCRGLMTHIGSANGVDQETAMKFVIEGLREILKDYADATKFLLEISAGAGQVIGDSFEELAEIIEKLENEHVAVCFDTAHAFASGYDIRTKAGVASVLKKFDETVGLDLLALSHCNDSKVGLGEKKDRHDHLGKGLIGLTGFKALVAHETFGKLDLILETPVEGVRGDIEVLKELRADL